MGYVRGVGRHQALRGSQGGVVAIAQFLIENGLVVCYNSSRIAVEEHDHSFFFVSDSSFTSRCIAPLVD